MRRSTRERVSEPPFSSPNDFSFCFIFQPVAATAGAAAMDPAKMENFMNGPLLKWVS